MSSTQNYATWGETVGNNYDAVETQDWYPWHNQWRGRPLAQRNFIKTNVAGYYPYYKTNRVIKTPPQKDWQYVWYYPCSTIFPNDPQYVANHEIILER